MPEQKEKTQTIAIRLPLSLHAAFQQLVWRRQAKAETRTSMEEVVRELIRLEIAQEAEHGQTKSTDD